MSKMFDMTLTLKDCTLLVNFFYKNNDCVPVALQKFRIFKGNEKGVGMMAVQGLLKIIQKFEMTGSFDSISISKFHFLAKNDEQHIEHVLHQSREI